MATFNTGLSIGGATTTISLEVNETSTNVGANTSNVHYRLVLYRSAGSQSGGADFNVNIDGGIRASGSNVSFTITPSSPRVFAEGDVTIGHNSDGTRTIGVNAFVNTGSGSGNAGGNVGLSNIPRYANFTSYGADQVNDQGYRIYCTMDATCNFFQYSLEDGVGWRDQDGSTRSDYSVTLNNRVSNKTQNLRVRVRRADSGLWTESPVFQVTTRSQNNFMDFFDTV